METYEEEVPVEASSKRASYLVVALLLSAMVGVVVWQQTRPTDAERLDAHFAEVRERNAERAARERDRQAEREEKALEGLDLGECREVRWRNSTGSRASLSVEVGFYTKDGIRVQTSYVYFSSIAHGETARDTIYVTEQDAYGCNVVGLSLY